MFMLHESRFLSSVGALLKSTTGNSAMCTFKLTYGRRPTSTTFTTHFLLFCPFGNFGSASGSPIFIFHSTAHPFPVTYMGGA